ncbi:MAG: VWA domain-containing protein [Spirochaetes bacterium]|nr:VWA domain-containing protein [Spirochaetota bacterium]
MKKQYALLYVMFFFLLMFLVISPVFAETKKANIQMAILLDTSGSMEGLIEQAKSHLWKIVNELATAKKDSQNVHLEVALYEYGKDSIPASEGYLRMIVPLSTDLDKISEELFKLTTYGGSEYCGQVIDSATKGLKWSKKNDDLKVIFIAGNEPFTQGELDYKKACKNAITKGINVNTIFCGNYQEGIDTQWKDGADLADGKYINIDHNQQIVHIDAPQDKELIKLNEELNNTYVPYGTEGESKKLRQEEQDANAASLSKEVMAQRAVAKASSHYDNASWDLVDAIKNKQVDVSKLKDKELPKELRGKSKKEINAYVDKMQDKRAKIQEKISKLNKAREKYVTEERKKLAGENSLDTAIIKALRKQASKKNFQMEK